MGTNFSKGNKGEKELRGNPFPREGKKTGRLFVVLGMGDFKEDTNTGGEIGWGNPGRHG